MNVNMNMGALPPDPFHPHAATSRDITLPAT